MSRETREKLLLAAMRLYGAEGLQAVSLRAISASAGSRNSAAMHYHFSDKAGVVDALVAFIFGHLADIADEIELAEKLQRGTDLRATIRLSLLPLAKLQQRYDWGSDAIQFLARLLQDGGGQRCEALNRHTRGLYETADTYLAQQLPSLDQQTRQLRLMFVIDSIFHGFAERASLRHTPLGDLSNISDGALLNQLVDYLAGGLEGPPHAERRQT